MQGSTKWRSRLRAPAVALAALQFHLAFHLPAALALSGGASQPEVQTFEPIQGDGLVDPFTGDLSYNIPLLDVGGYPLNLVYQSGITMDQEASFVGLGWNVNPGAIQRNVRGLPDDFAGEEIKKETHLKPSVTVGASVGADLELFGYSPPAGLVTPSVQLGVSYNTYRGVGVDLGMNAGVTAGEGAKGSLTANLGISSNSGVTFGPALSFASLEKTSYGSAEFGGGLGFKWSSRDGLQSLTWKGSYNARWARAADRWSRDHAGGSISFARPTYTPSISTPMRSTSYALRLKLGGELFGTTGNAQVEGYGSLDTLAEPVTAIPAYGYVYAHRAAGARRVLHDFNRERDDEFAPTQPNLPVTQFTHDLYAASGQGFQGQFRPYRSDVGTLHDHEVSSSGIDGVSAGLELAGGNAIKAGGNFVVNLAASRAGLWVDDNASEPKFRFQGVQPDQPLYEPVYFKLVGEATPLSESAARRFDDLGGRRAVRLALDGQSLSAALTTADGRRLTLGSTVLGDRQPRSAQFSFLTAAEAHDAALEKELRAYVRPFEEFDPGPGLLRRFDPIPRARSHRQPHHISEVTITRGDGTRYVYGLPAYNLTQEEVSFNVGPKTGGAPAAALAHDASLVRGYAVGIDDSGDNARGRSHYFSRTTTPPYAYAYLITAIVSADYVDVTGDGPTSDDLGTYTKFNYRLHQERYRWRAPYTERASAFFQENHASDEDDDLGSYVYGEKEIWYLHSIESKNYLAEFELSPRDDAIGIAGRGGGLPSATDPSLQRLLKLDRIRLFNKGERLAQKDAAVPLKTVTFSYDYSLSPDVKNALVERGTTRKGKLTLRKVAFSYRESQRGELSPFVFHYSSHNPRYDLESSDRWGSYRPNRDALSNRRFPYVAQADRGAADRNASAWQLAGVELPSGGRLDFEYESDDYAYVQSRRATFMAPVEATGRITTSPRREACGGGGSCGPLYDRSGEPVQPLFFFRLLEPLAADQREALGEYVRDLGELYVNAEVRVDGDRFEPIQTFLPVAGEGAEPRFGVDYGFDETRRSGDRFTHGWIRVRSGDDHPLSQAAWQYIRRNLPRIAYRQPSAAQVAQMEDRIVEGNPAALVEILPGIVAGMLDGVADALIGFDNKMRLARRADAIRLDRSFIRLRHPSGAKLGGGSRVKRVSLADRWGEMTRYPGSARARVNHTYDQRFEYTRTELRNGREMTVSSGVAAYEPLLGGDENPLVEPLWYTHNGDRLFQLTPVGEAFYPAPLVGYERVKVTNLAPGGVSGTGHTVHEFHTAREFPVKVERTAAARDRHLLPFLPVPFPFSEDHLSVSQGFAIELNSMHGKPRATWTYQEGAGTAPISGTSYRYRPLSEGRLPVLTRQPRAAARAEERTAGLDYELVVDTREHTSQVDAPGLQLNVDGFFAAIFPVFIPTPYPEYSHESTRFRSATVTKVIHQAAIVEEVRAYDSGAGLATANERWDAETGEVILTSTETEFPGKRRYRLGVPAHLDEAGMAGAWRNQGLVLQDVRVEEGGRLAAGRSTEHFFAGDEVLLEPMPAAEPGPSPREAVFAWVWKVYPGAVALIDRRGQHVPAGRFASAKIVRSGHRNLQSLSAGQVASLASPIREGAVAFREVISASALEYAQHWQTYGPYQVFRPGEGGQSRRPMCSCRPLAPSLRELLQELKNRSMLTAVGARLPDVLGRPELAAVRDYLDRHARGWSRWEGRIEGSLLSGSITSESGAPLARIELRNPRGPFTPILAEELDFATFTHRRDYRHECGDSGKFVVQAGRATEGQAVLGFSDRLPAVSCEVSMRGVPAVRLECGLAEGAVVNPYVQGILGSWRPRASWSYLTDRIATDRVASSGAFQRFEPFWPNLGGADRSRWHWTEETTVIDPFGRPLESRDALGRNQARLQGFDFGVTTSAAANARQHEVAADGFEDYSYTNRPNFPGVPECPTPRHWSFQDAAPPRTPSDEQSHAGRHSLRLDRESVRLTRRIEATCDGPRPLPAGELYRVQRCDVIPAFSPPPGRYLLSAWVKTRSRAGAPADAVPAPGPAVLVTAGAFGGALRPQGIAIDGWQRIHGELAVPAGATSIDVVLQSGPVQAWFDDLRIQPFDAEMEGFVHDSSDLRLRATLDAENHATFYDYDSEGSLSRVKVETAEGVMTVKEVSRGTPKPPRSL
jgi:hypothetical protein